jgi:hypothetical protein
MGFAECLGHSASLGILVVICSASWWWHRSFYYGRARAKAAYGHRAAGQFLFIFSENVSHVLKHLHLVKS